MQSPNNYNNIYTSNIFYLLKLLKINKVIEYLRLTHSELKIKICYTDIKGYFIIGSRKVFRARFLRQNSDVPILSHKMTSLKVNLFLKD